MHNMHRTMKILTSLFDVVIVELRF